MTAGRVGARRPPGGAPARNRLARTAVLGVAGRVDQEYNWAMRLLTLRALLGALIALALLVTPAGARVAPPDLPPPPAADGAQIAAAFAKLSRDTSWQLVQKVPLRFDAYHPEGIVRLGDHYVLSAVQVTEPTQKYQPPGTIIDGTDRTPGKGIAHLIAFDAQGNKLADERVDDGGTIYHPGGLDYDGRDLWLAVAEYRPNKPSIIYRVDPISLVPEEVRRSPDHIGGIVHDTRRHRVLGLNWGSRTEYEWKLTGHGAVVKAAITNPSHFVDYQDCKYLGRPRGFEDPAMLCSGIATLHHPGPDGQPVSYDLGGVAEVDVTTMRPIDEVPFQEYTDQRQVATRNALDVQVVDGRLRLYLVADDNQSNLLVYEAS
jgi:hypothetical protein